MKHSLSLLIITDRSENIEYTKKLLRHSRDFQFDIHQANSSRSALKLINQYAIDVILIFSDNLEIVALRKLHTHDSHPVIIVISSTYEKKKAISAIKYGADDYLVKDSLNNKGLLRAILFANERKERENTLKKYASHLTMQFRIATALAEADNLKNATHSVLKSICEILHWQTGELWAIDQINKLIRHAFSWYDKNNSLSAETLKHTKKFHFGDGIPGHIWKIKSPYWISDLSKHKFKKNYQLTDDSKIKSCFGFPIIFQDETLAVMLFFSNHTRKQDDNFISMFKAISSQIGTYIKQKHIEGDLLYLSQHDLLTGLANRLSFEQQLHTAIVHSKNNHHFVAVIYFDLDYFKKINETQGHATGDALLQEVANRLRNSMKSTDTLARFGGDEFGIILSNVTNQEYIVVTAKKILETLSAPYHIHNKEFHITVSIGISIYPQDGLDSQTLIKNADIAMYHAKNSGRNNYQFCPHNIEPVAQRKITLENELYHALKQNEFILYYQPIINLKSEKIVGLETLLRWKRQDNRIINPDEFIPIIEQTNLMLSIGEWIIKTACKQTQTLIDLGINSIAINISVQQLNQHMITLLNETLKETNFDPKNLVLEVTESILMQETESNIYILNALNNLGINISIDDFGIGYSSLSYLKTFPIQSIKIDKSFIIGIPHNPNAKAIVSAIIAMAHSLDIKIIGEGIETQEQIDFLKQHGCDEYQGFYFCEPSPINELSKVLTSYMKKQ